MSACVRPMHYVTVQFRLFSGNKEEQIIEVTGEHRFLYGVESWIDGVDQQLESLERGDVLELIFDEESSSDVASRLLQENGVEKRLALDLKIVEVIEAEPREIIKALADSVNCCDHCGNH